MPQQRFRNSRTRQKSRRTQVTIWQRDVQLSPHERAINRLTLELRAREGVMGLFHAGITWRALLPLIVGGRGVWVEREKALRIGSKRYVPDLIVRPYQAGPITLVIEVWHTHSVKGNKRAAFNSAGVPWIEVRSWHVLSRRRKQALPILDWGGYALPPPPLQQDLFDDRPDRSRASSHACRLGLCNPPRQANHDSRGDNGNGPAPLQAASVVRELG